MMKTWRRIRLGDFCITNANSYSPREEWKFVNYLDTSNITDNKIDSIQYIDVEKDELPSRARRKVQKDSIVYSTVRTNQASPKKINKRLQALLNSKKKWQKEEKNSRERHKTCWIKQY